MVPGAVQFGGLLPKTAIKKPGRGLEPQGNGSCFPRAPIHRGRKWTAFLSPGHAVTEPQLDRERFSKRGPWMALGQCGWELSSGPVPRVSASYVSMGMKRDANSHVISVILDRLSLNFRLVPANLLLVSPPSNPVTAHHSQACCLTGHQGPQVAPIASASHCLFLQRVCIPGHDVTLLTLPMQKSLHHPQDLLRRPEQGGHLQFRGLETADSAQVSLEISACLAVGGKPKLSLGVRK